MEAEIQSTNKFLIIFMLEIGTANHNMSTNLSEFPTFNGWTSGKMFSKGLFLLRI